MGKSGFMTKIRVWSYLCDFEEPVGYSNNPIKLEIVGVWEWLLPPEKGQEQKTRRPLKNKEFLVAWYTQNFYMFSHKLVINFH